MAFSKEELAGIVADKGKTYKRRDGGPSSRPPGGYKPRGERGKFDEGGFTAQGLRDRFGSDNFSEDGNFIGNADDLKDHADYDMLTRVHSHENHLGKPRDHMGDGVRDSNDLSGVFDYLLKEGSTDGSKPAPIQDIQLSPRMAEAVAFTDAKAERDLSGESTRAVFGINPVTGERGREGALGDFVFDYKSRVKDLLDPVTPVTQEEIKARTRLA